jgi:hypothetical protein
VNDLGTDSSDVDICITTPFPGLHCIKTLASVLQKSNVSICIFL